MVFVKMAEEKGECTLWGGRVNAHVAACLVTIKLDPRSSQSQSCWETGGILVQHEGGGLVLYLIGDDGPLVTVFPPPPMTPNHPLPRPFGDWPRIGAGRGFRRVVAGGFPQIGVFRSRGPELVGEVADVTLVDLDRRQRQSPLHGPGPVRPVAHGRHSKHGGASG